MTDTVRGETDGRPRRPLLATVVGVTALLAAATFTVTRITASASAGGAATPQAAGTAFVSAIAHEDVLAVLDLVLPNERETLRDGTTELMGELQRLHLLGDDTSAAGGGEDLGVADATVAVEPTNAADIADVTVTATVDTGALPFASLVDELAGRGTEPSAAGGRRRISLPLAAVQRNGRWYLSIAYSIAESARHALTGSPDIPAVGPAPVGARSPQAAMDDLLRGIGAGDVTAIIQALDPHEFEALQRYAPLFTADLRSAIDDVDGTVTFDHPTYRVAGSGETRAVTFASVGIAYRLGAQTGHVTLADGCWSATSSDGAASSCTTTGGRSASDDLVSNAFADFVDPGITVTRIDGAWFVSPVASGLDELVAVARALDPGDVERIRPAVERVLQELDAGGRPT